MLAAAAQRRLGDTETCTGVAATRAQRALPAYGTHLPRYARRWRAPAFCASRGAAALRTLRICPASVACATYIRLLLARAPITHGAPWHYYPAAAALILAACAGIAAGMAACAFASPSSAPAADFAGVAYGR
jgi:hypothetical protein